MMDLTPSHRITRKRTPEELDFQYYLMEQFRAVDSFCGCLRMGAEMWAKELEVKVVQGAKKLQWEKALSIGSIYRGSNGTA